MVERNKRPVYYCRRVIDTDNDIETFSEPEKRYINLKPISGEMLIAVGGELNSQYLTARVNLPNLHDFEEGDRAYIFVSPPQMHDLSCEKADYVLKSVLYGHRVLELAFMKRI